MSCRYAFFTAFTLFLVAGCAETPPAPASQVQSSALACEGKYGIALAAGATASRPVPPLEVGPQPGGRRTAYACIMVTVNENGEPTDARLLETDYPAFGEHLIGLALKARYQPAQRDGKPFVHQSVVSAAYW